ncbi:MAG: AraC family transcriptional regulator [Clostridiales bacterium]|nr:AraC family transcriptional regulator [Clostridiales bacterium]
MDTDRSIADICLEAGFNSRSNCGQVFKGYFLCTPREYRERMRRL